MEKGTQFNGSWCDMGGRLRECRKMRRLTQEELCEAVELIPENGGKVRSAKQIGYIESGTRKLSMEYARLLAKALDVNVEYLLLESNFKTKDEEIRSRVECEAEKISESFDDQRNIRICVAKFIKSLGFDITIDGVWFDEDSGYFDDFGATDDFGYITLPDGKCAELTLRDVEQLVFEIISFAKHELMMPFDPMWQILRRNGENYG